MLANRVARKTFDYVQQLIGAYPTAYPNYNVVVACLPGLGVTAAVLALDTVFAKRVGGRWKIVWQGSRLNSVAKVSTVLRMLLRREP